MIKEFKKEMTQEFEMTDLSSMRYFLGIEVKQDKTSIFMTQEAYANNILKKFKMEHCNPVATHMELGTKISKFEGGVSVDRNLYQSLVGSLRYLTCTRPDIAYSVGIVSRYMEDLKQSHWKEIKRILRYIQGTKSVGLFYSSTKNYNLVGYSDSDWCGDEDDRKSTSGYLFFIGETSFTWLLGELKIPQQRSTEIRIDNKSVIELAKNPVHHERSKHIDVRFHFIREHVKEKNVHLRHVASHDQIADLLTKPLSKTLLDIYKRLMGMKDRKKKSFGLRCSGTGIGKISLPTDGPVLGMEFDEVPPGPFGEPISAARDVEKPVSAAKNVISRGFEKQMEKWMGACDCIITKAGPGTIAKSLIRGLPIILNDYIPGQFLLLVQVLTKKLYKCRVSWTEFEELVYKKKDFEKEAGNVAYKKKDFENVIKCYSQAVELEDKDILFLTNMAAVYLEMGKFEECIKDCDKAVQRGRELRLDFKMIAKALTRNGVALVKMAKCSKDYEPAIETFQKALTEHRNPDTLKKLNDAEKVKKDLEQHEYFDPKIADEEREKGNEFFKQQKYPEAIKQYTESLKRNPKDHKATKQLAIQN
ncbi:hypothetical protein AgCh_022645 [Apium graveolens]